MPIKIIALAFCALASAGSAWAGPAVQATTPLENAAQAYGQGRTGTALDICLEGLEANPADRALYLYAVDILPEERSKYGALLDAVNSRTPGAAADYAHFLGLCKIYRTTGRLTDALPNCKKALSLEPTLWPVYRELGLTYSKSGNRRKAAEYFSQGVEISSGNYQAHYHLAAEYEKAGDRAGAMKHYRRALDLAKKSAGAAARTDSDMIAGRIRRLGVKKETVRQPAKPKPEPVKPAPSPAAPKPATFEACARDAAEAERNNEIAAAAEKLSACAALAPQNARVRYDRANLLLRLGKYEPAVEEYQRAAGLFVKNSPQAPGGQPGAGDRSLAASCHVKIAQTWDKLGDREKVISHYQKALDINKNDLNALLGLAAAYEARPDLAAAAALYQRALKADPANARAKARLEELNFGLLSDAELLAELKERRAADAAKTELSEEDRETVRNMREAERHGAVDFLKSKMLLMRGFTVSRETQAGTKLLLTQAGFRTYHGHLTRDAVQLFEKKGIRLQDVFVLKDLKGKPIFDPAGKLTGDGMTAYWQARDGAKSWLLPHEAPPAPPDAAPPVKEKDPPEVGRAERDGYREISEPEYSWLLQATECPELTLTEKPREILRVIKGPEHLRYFLCYIDGAICAMKGTTKLALYVEGYRAGDTKLSKGNRSTAFFGTGAVEKKRFCHNGKIWMGD